MEDIARNMLRDICGTDLFNSIFNSLAINLFSDEGEYAGVLEIIRNLHDSVIMPVALMLMFIYFMITVVDKLSQENFTWEQLWRQIALLLIVKLLIEHGFDLLGILFNIGMALAAQIEIWTGFSPPEDFIGLLEFAEANGYETTIAAYKDWTNYMMEYMKENTVGSASAMDMLDAFRESLDLGMDVINDLVAIVFLLIPWLVSWVMKICVSIICYTRVIEIYARATFAPVALADFYNSGLQSNGWRFLKSFLAVCLQGGMILVIATIYSSLVQNLIYKQNDLFAFTGAYIAFGAASIMLMFKSLSLTKEIVGAN